MSNDIICEKTCKQPVHKTLKDAYISLGLGWGGEPEIEVCENGFQSTGVHMPLHMYELLRELINDSKVVEYYENLRNT